MARNFLLGHLLEDWSSMSGLLISELGKAFKNKWFLLALLVGCALACIAAQHSIQEYLQYYDNVWQMRDEYVYGDSLYSCYVKWMSVYGLDKYVNIFYSLAPLLACVPYSWTLGREVYTHYVDQLFARCSRGKVLFAKVIAAFSVGFVVVVVPQLVNFLATACFIPATTPSVLDQTYNFITDQNLLASLFYTHPLIYTIVYLLISGTLCGLWSAFVLCFSGFALSRVVSILVPYLSLIVVQFLNVNVFSSLLGGVMGMQLSLFENIRAFTLSYEQDGRIIIGEGLLLLALTAVLSLRKARKDSL